MEISKEILNPSKVETSQAIFEEILKKSSPETSTISASIAPSSGLTVEMRKLRKDEFRDAQKFLSNGLHLSLIKPIDLVYGAFVDLNLVGLTRIAPEFEVYFFRGIDLKKSFCDRGFETRLAQLALEEARDKDCFALAEKKDRDFYSILGFKELETVKTPEHLRKRIDQATRQKILLIAMKRSKS